MVGSAWMPWLRPIVGVQLVLEGAPLQGLQHRVELGQDQVGGALELDRQRRVEQVGGGQPEMEESRLLAADLLDMGEEGDHVVPRERLDLLDPAPGRSAARGGLRSWRPRSRTGSGGTAPIAAIASAAASSTSSQMPSRVSGDEDRRHLGPAVARDHSMLTGDDGDRPLSSGSGPGRGEGATPEDVLAFWFAPGNERRWFEVDPEFDVEIAARFGA